MQLLSSLAFSYTEAIEILQEAVKAGQKFEYPVEWGIDLQTEHERLSHRAALLESQSLLLDYPAES